MVTEPISAEEAVAARQAQIGASWFYWIAGLTVVNVVTSLYGLALTFLLSLLLPLFMASDAHQHHSGGEYVGTVIITALGVGAFLVFGHFAKKGARWAFALGLIFYGIDTLLWIGRHEWLALALHGYALWRIGGGLGAANRLAALRRQSAPAAWAPPQGQYADTSEPQQWPPAPTSAPELVQAPADTVDASPSLPVPPPIPFPTLSAPARQRQAQSQEQTNLASEIDTPDSRLDTRIDTRIDAPDTEIGTISDRIDAPGDRIDTPEV